MAGGKPVDAFASLLRDIPADEPETACREQPRLHTPEQPETSSGRPHYHPLDGVEAAIAVIGSEEGTVPHPQPEVEGETVLQRKDRPRARSGCPLFEHAHGFGANATIARRRCHGERRQ